MIHEYILNKFLSVDELRPQFMDLIEAGEYVYATDTYTAIRCKKNLINRKIQNPEKVPNFDSHFSFKDLNILSVKTIDLMQPVLKCRFEYLKTSCKECSGSGIKTCEHCESEYECKECSGTGDCDLYPFIIQTEFGTNPLIKIGERYFKSHFVDRLVYAATVLGIEQFEILNDTSNENGAFFKLNNDVDVIIMQYHVNKPF